MVEHRCNKCGKKMDTFDVRNGLSYEKTMSYGSRFDFEHVRLDLCCECLDNLLESCVVSPFVPDAVAEF